jgi:hypothetical protein
VYIIVIIVLLSGSSSIDLHEMNIQLLKFAWDSGALFPVRSWVIWKVLLFKPGFRVRIHLIRIRIQHFRLDTDPNPIRIQCFDDKKIEKFTAGK